MGMIGELSFLSPIADMSPIPKSRQIIRIILVDEIYLKKNTFISVSIHTEALKGANITVIGDAIYIFISVMFDVKQLFLVT